MSCEVKEIKWDVGMYGLLNSQIFVVTHTNLRRGRATGYRLRRLLLDHKDAWEVADSAMKRKAKPLWLQAGDEIMVDGYYLLTEDIHYAKEENKLIVTLYHDKESRWYKYSLKGLLSKAIF